MDLIMMKFLNYGAQQRNYGMMNFVLERCIKGALISSVDEMNPKYLVSLSAYILQVCDYLKSKPKFGGFGNNLIIYLDHALQALGNSPVNIETMKLNSSIHFNKGIYLIQIGENEKAKKSFKNSFLILQMLFQVDPQKMIELLKGLVRELKSKGDLQNSIFFYEELSKFKFQNEEQAEHLQLSLAQLYFLNQDMNNLTK